MTLSEKPGLQSVRVTLGAVLTICALVAIGSLPTARAEVRLQAPHGRAAPDGPTWSAPYNVSDPSEVESEMPALAITNSGVAHIVWEEGGELYHSYREAGSWSDPSSIPGVGSGEQPALEAGPNSSVHLVYVDDVDIWYADVFYLAWDGSDWSLPRSIFQTSGSGDFTQVFDSPDIAVAPDGSIHIVAGEQTTYGQQLYYATLADSSSWVAYAPIPQAYGGSPSIDVADEYTVCVAYRHETEDDIYVLNKTHATWSSPQNVSNTPSTSSTAPDLALGRSGTPEVVWQETLTGTDQIQYSRGAAWSSVLTLSNSTGGAKLPSLTIDAFGYRYVAWDDETFPFAIRHTWTSDPGTWPDPGLVHASSLSLEDVSLDVGRDGVVHAAWTKIQVGKGEILYASAKVHDVFNVFLPLVMTDVGP